MRDTAGMRVEFGAGAIELRQGDITELAVDAIVNAANSALRLGAGVAGAIRRRGGPSIQEECDRLGGCAVGDAVVTGGGNLPARQVIHAVGPRGGDPDADRLLWSAATRSLEIARDRGFATIAFPAISTGVFGFPLARCAEILLRAAAEFLAAHPRAPTLVLFCLFDREAYEAFAKALALL